MCQVSFVPVSGPLLHHHTLLAVAWPVATAGLQESAQHDTVCTLAFIGHACL